MNVQLVLAVCLVQLGVVQSQTVTCSSNQPGTSCTTSDSCRTEHPPVGTSTDDYIRSTCDPSYGGVFSMPASLQNMICPHKYLYQHCDIAVDNEYSTKDEGVPEVRVELETETLDRFSAHISWKHNVSKTKGYQVQVFQGNEMSLVACFCVNDKDARNLSITRSGHLTFDWRSERLRAAVAPYPLPLSPLSQSAITGQYSLGWPSSCLDLGTHNCYPPTYPAPSNIQLHTSIYNTSEGVETRRLDIQWDAVTPNSSCNHTSNNLSVYIDLQHQLFDKDWGWYVENDYFNVKTTCNNSRISVSLFPLNFSVNYTHVRLLTHYPCAGLAVSTKNIGCGNFGPSVDIPLPPSPPSSTSVLPPSTSAPSPTTTAATTTTIAAPNTDPSVSIIVAVLVVSVTLITIVAVAIVVLVIVMKKIKPSPCPPSPLPPRSTKCTLPPPSPLPKSEPMVTEPLPSCVFVFYSLQSENEEYILTNIVQALVYRVGIDISHPRRLGRELIPKWIEQEVQRAVTVFIVCNEAFSNAWKEKNCPYVNAFKHMIYSKIMESDVKKFAVVVLNDDERYIPTDYLRTLTKFTIKDCDNDEGMDEIDLMVQFIRDSSPCELHVNPDEYTECDALSPQSDITMRICSPVHHPTRSTDTSPAETVCSTNSSILLDTFSSDLSQDSCVTSGPIEDPA